MTGTAWWVGSAGVDTSQGTSVLDLVFGLGHLGFAGNGWSIPRQELGHCMPFLIPAAVSAPKRRWGTGRDIFSLVLEPYLATSLLWELDTI